jgi:hypothetical protein
MSPNITSCSRFMFVIFMSTKLCKCFSHSSFPWPSNVLQSTYSMSTNSFIAPALYNMCTFQVNSHSSFTTLGWFHWAWLFWSHNSFLLTAFLRWKFVCLSTYHLPGGPVHHIYNHQGRVAQLYPQSRGTHFSSLYDLHGLQWDNSLHWSPHGN